MIETQELREMPDGTFKAYYRLFHERADGTPVRELTNVTCPQSGRKVPNVGDKVKLGDKALVVESVDVVPVNEKMGEWELVVNCKAAPVEAQPVEAPKVPAPDAPIVPAQRIWGAKEHEPMAGITASDK
jgi:hypothetical protein